MSKLRINDHDFDMPEGSIETGRLGQVVLEHPALGNFHSAAQNFELLYPYGDRFFPISTLEAVDKQIADFVEELGVEHSSVLGTAYELAILGVDSSFPQRQALISSNHPLAAQILRLHDHLHVIFDQGFPFPRVRAIIEKLRAAEPEIRKEFDYFVTNMQTSQASRDRIKTFFADQEKGKMIIVLPEAEHPDFLEPEDQFEAFKLDKKIPIEISMHHFEDLVMVKYNQGYEFWVVDEKFAAPKKEIETQKDDRVLH